MFNWCVINASSHIYLHSKFNFRHLFTSARVKYVYESQYRFALSISLSVSVIRLSVGVKHSNGKRLNESASRLLRNIDIEVCPINSAIVIFGVYGLIEQTDI
jgi:hypothetical protein